jgi:excinuclease ABC subunit A
MVDSAIDMTEFITIKGAREHNLKNVSVKLPRNKMICFSGLSGSGKSSLAFDTIFAEGQRRYVESLSAYARQFLGQMQKPDVDEIEGLSPAISIDQKAHSANPRSTVATITEIYDYLRVLYARVGIPHCPQCDTVIRKMTIDEMVDRVVREAERFNEENADKKKFKKVLILAPVVRGRKGEYYQLLYDFYNDGFAKARIDGTVKSLSERVELSKYKQHTIEIVMDELTKDELQKITKDTRQRLSEAVQAAAERAEGLVTIAFPDGTEKLFSTKWSCPNDGFAFPEIEPRLFSFNSPYGACDMCHGLGTESLFSEALCTKCKGDRLRPEALKVMIGDKSIVNLTAMDIESAVDFFLGLELDATEKVISEAVMKEIISRLQFMLDVGLNYLTLNRRAGTLSGGEAQRIRLASQIGSRLVGALYVLDEPTIGLHQRDNDKLIATLKDLRDIGNTIIVVEHDEDTIRASDYLVDFGPAAGKYGGEIVAEGPMPEILKDKKSLTAAYLRGDKKIEVPKNRRAPRADKLKIVGATENNLKNINVEIPLGRFTCITGVSGSGKSTLMHDIVYQHLARRLGGTEMGKQGKVRQVLGAEYLDRVILIDQGAIGRTPRSNPATYTGMWTHIRDLFATTEEARFRGFSASRFSFNRPGGRCENCEGNGQIAIEMHFLPTVFVTCDICRGKRFDRETLEVLFRGKSIFDVLEMPIDDAHTFFKDIPAVEDRLKVLREVGLGYLTLGQSATTLSGGEAQRIKLANELAKRQYGKTMYLFDEPTTGLHFEDIRKLLEVMTELLDRGNTVVVIEHNLDVIKVADWLIDMGPEGGDKGGTVVGVGTPEDIANNKKSYTGQYLKRVLKK